MKNIREKGITLIALVITIIVLLILAGVVLYALTGNTSIIDNANYAVTEYNKSANSDQNVLNDVENLFDKYLSNSPTVELQQQYGGLVTPEDTIEPELFTWEPITEPGVAVVRNTPNSGVDGIVSRGDTPTTIAQKGTARITGINWEYFMDEVEEGEEEEEEVTRDFSYSSSTSKGLTTTELYISTSDKKEQIEKKLRKLIIPYEVSKKVDGETKTYVVTSINSNSSFVMQDNANSIPVFSTGSTSDGVTYYHGIETDSSYTSTLIIPNSITTLEGVNLGILPRDIVLFSADSPITAIPDNFFRDYGPVKRISLPNNLISIGEGAFRGCGELQELTIPDSVTTIGKEAFYECSRLRAINVPNGVTTLEDFTFYSCHNLTTVNLGNGLTNIGKSVFSGTGLTNITIPNNVTTIGQGAFNYLDIESITIPDTVTTIGKVAFYSCDRLTNITIPNNVTTIGGGAFMYTGIKTVTYKGVTYKKINELITALNNNNVNLLVETVYTKNKKDEDVGPFERIKLEEDT